MKPLRDMVLISPEFEKMSEFIHIEKDKDEKAHMGLVIKTGPDVKHVKPKDKVIFQKHRAHIFEIEKQPLYLIQEEDVYAKVET